MPPVSGSRCVNLDTGNNPCDGAVGRLPDGARQVFVLHDIEGYRHEEIADMLGIVPGTSKSQLHHARMALRKHLDR